MGYVKHIRYMLPLAVLLSCNNGNKPQNLLEAKTATAISCTSIGLTPNDSVLYLQQGGQQFQSSFVNAPKPPGPAPTGMVWIPGGEFSMGSINPVGLEGGGNLKMNDAQ